MSDQPDPAWFGRGSCSAPGVDVALFFPGQGADTKPATAICATCPVTDECLEYGMTQRFGIWGGLSERERRRLRRQRQGRSAA